MLEEGRDYYNSSHNVSDSSSIDSYSKVGEQDPRRRNTDSCSSSGAGSPLPTAGAAAGGQAVLAPVPGTNYNALYSPDSSPEHFPRNASPFNQPVHRLPPPAGPVRTISQEDRDLYDVPSEISPYSKINCIDATIPEYDSSAGSFASTDTVIERPPRSVVPNPMPPISDYVTENFMASMASTTSSINDGDLSGEDSDGFEDHIESYSKLGEMSDDGSDESQPFLDGSDDRIDPDSAFTPGPLGLNRLVPQDGKVPSNKSVPMPTLEERGYVQAPPDQRKSAFNTEPPQSKPLFSPPSADPPHMAADPGYIAAPMSSADPGYVPAPNVEDPGYIPLTEAIAGPLQNGLGVQSYQDPGYVGAGVLCNNYAESLDSNSGDESDDYRQIDTLQSARDAQENSTQGMVPVVGKASSPTIESNPISAQKSSMPTLIPHSNPDRNLGQGSVDPLYVQHPPFQQSAAMNSQSPSTVDVRGSQVQHLGISPPNTNNYVTVGDIPQMSSSSSSSVSPASLSTTSSESGDNMDQKGAAIQGETLHNPGYVTLSC